MTETAPGLGEFDFAGDDQVVPFQVEGLDVRGRAVQLGPMLDAILERHNYPLPVARLVAETVVLTVLLGTSLKFEGKLIVQTQGDGPVDLVVADFSTPDRVRAYARYDKEALADAEKSGRVQPHVDPSSEGEANAGCTASRSASANTLAKRLATVKHSEENSPSYPVKVRHTADAAVFRGELLRSCAK